MSDKNGDNTEDIQWGKLVGAGGIVFGTLYWVGLDGIVDLFVLFTMVVVLPVIFLTCALFCLYEPCRGIVSKFLGSFIDAIFTQLDKMETKVEEVKEKVKTEEEKVS